jgi:hypothetical protein
VRSSSSSSSSPREASETSGSRVRPNAEGEKNGEEEEGEGGDPHRMARELREAREALRQLQRENAELRALRAEERQQASEAQYEEAEKKQLMKTIRLLAKERRTSQHVMNLTRFKAEMRALELEAELHQERTLRRRAESQALSPHHAHAHDALDDNDDAHGQAPEMTTSGGIAGKSPVENYPGGHPPLGGGGSATEDHSDLARRLERELAQERQEKHQLRQLYGKRIAELEALVERLQEEGKLASAHKWQDRINHHHHHHSTYVDDVDHEMDALHSSLEMSRAVSREHGLALICPPPGVGAPPPLLCPRSCAGSASTLPVPHTLCCLLLAACCCCLLLAAAAAAGCVQREEHRTP